MSVAKIYAKALFLAATESRPADVSVELNGLTTQLNQVAATIASSKELEIALHAPITTSREKMAVVRELAKQMQLTKLMGDFLALMAMKNRLALLADVRREFVATRLLAEGGLPGALTTAEQIAEKDIENLAKAFTKKLGKRVAFQVSVDPSLLAGIKVTVNGVTYDGTLRSQLQRLRDQFLVGATGGNVTS
jgi:F-type H+-transporting ATPase subunit delta